MHRRKSCHESIRVSSKITESEMEIGCAIVTFEPTTLSAIRAPE